MPEILQKPASVKQLGVGEGDEKSVSPPTKHSFNAETPKRKLSWKVFLFAGALGFVVLTLILVSFAKPRQSMNTDSGEPDPLVPTPTVVPRPTVPDFSLGEPTVYANDPQILQLEGALKSFERQLDEIDYREQDLDPPVLLMEVDFTD